MNKAVLIRKNDSENLSWSLQQQAETKMSLKRQSKSFHLSLVLSWIARCSHNARGRRNLKDEARHPCLPFRVSNAFARTFLLLSVIADTNVVSLSWTMFRHCQK
jgi:hypothetical protein